MLDEPEWEELMAAHDLRPPGDASAPPGIAERFSPLLDTYERLTGIRETNPAAIWHHRLSL